MSRTAAVAGLLVLASVVWVLVGVDLDPRVESDFFFSTDDPQLQDSQAIAELFPSNQQLLISATAPDVSADDYVERIHRLTEDLAAVPGVASVQSLTRGPGSPDAVPQSPLWSRLLLGSNPRSTLILAMVEGEGGGDLATRIEALLADHHTPSFALDVSGVPYVVELVRRYLGRDLRTFSLAALVIFGLLVALVYRSVWVVAGTLTCCLGACGVTLAALSFLDVPIGLLTANIITIVFVLALSHIVFLTANWRDERSRATEDDLAGATDRAVAATFGASFWCMVTTLLGFGSLLFASAKPLRELGLAGALGSAVAICVAYGLYPAFLHALARRADGAKPEGAHRAPAFTLPPATWATAGLLFAAAVVGAFGLPKLDTDPNLLSYFAPGSELRAGLERIDRDGGSSPLLLVVKDPEGAALDGDGPMGKLAALQAALEEDPEVGTCLSLPVLLDEARRVPMAFFFSTPQLLDLLDTPTFDHIAASFVTKDRQRALYFLRMGESDRGAPRREVIERLRRVVEEKGLHAERVGGLYELQASLGSLVSGSLLRGLGGLFLLFIPVGLWVARGARPALAMIVALAAVPLLVLGLFGHAGLPLDVISSPAANVAIALGIDAMIHLATAARRRREAGASPFEAWAGAREMLWPAILGATAILAVGFGIFALSSFPPTQRFGIAVAFGTAAAAAMALFALPRLAARADGR
ncbi:MAG: MMPL family transporter [Acidobacteriota bacterium]